jgi:hypothetical protein
VIPGRISGCNPHPGPFMRNARRMHPQTKAWSPHRGCKLGCSHFVPSLQKGAKLENRPREYSVDHGGNRRRLTPSSPKTMQRFSGFPFSSASKETLL